MYDSEECCGILTCVFDLGSAVDSKLVNCVVGPAAYPFSVPRRTGVLDAYLRPPHPSNAIVPFPLSPALQYACKSNQLPWTAARVKSTVIRPSLLPSIQMPIHFVYLHSCELGPTIGGDEEGLACQYALNFTEARALSQYGSPGVSAAEVRQFRMAVRGCDPIKGFGHQADLVAVCDGESNTGIQ